MDRDICLWILIVHFLLISYWLLMKNEIGIDDNSYEPYGSFSFEKRQKDFKTPISSEYEKLLRSSA